MSNRITTSLAGKAAMSATLGTLALLLALSGPVNAAESAKTTSVPEVPEHSETVMTEGQTITAVTPAGKIRIEAGPGLIRRYTWDGATREVTMQPREERYAGSLGIHFEGKSDHWQPHNGLTRVDVEEGQRHFENMDDAKIWIQIRRLHFVHTDDGLVVGWRRQPEKATLQVEVWQFYVGGEKPTTMAGAQNHRIDVHNNVTVASSDE